MVKLSKSVLLVHVALFSTIAVNAQKRPATTGEIMGRRVSKTLKILSPLQSLTFFQEDETAKTTPRDDFLPKFQAGLTAETKTRELLARRREMLTSGDDGISVGSDGWGEAMEERERIRSEKEEEIVDSAWDRATAPFQKKSETDTVSSSGSKYQFVGVIQPPNSEKKVKWYARKRPAGSKWNIRMLHVNKDAIVRDMFTSGKVDIMGKYVNTGEPADEVKEGEVPSLKPLIKGEYSVKPRSVW